MTDETSPLGVHSADNIEADSFHFNVVEVVRQAKAEFERLNPGKTAAYFYAPDRFLQLLDRSVKDNAFHGVSDEILNKSTVTNIFGLELVSIPGTCFTVTAEAVHDAEPEKRQPVAQIIPRDQTPN